jgi:hypothetical protein
MGFVVDKVASVQVFSEYFGFPCQNRSFHHFLHHHHNHSGQLAEALRRADHPSKESCCPRSSKRNETECFMEAAKAQIWAIEPHEKKNMYVYIGTAKCYFKALPMWKQLFICNKCRRRSNRDDTGHIDPKRVDNSLFRQGGETWVGCGTMCVSSTTRAFNPHSHGVTPASLLYLHMNGCLGWG